MLHLRPYRAMPHFSLYCAMLHLRPYCVRPLDVRFETLSRAQGKTVDSAVTARTAHDRADAVLISRVDSCSAHWSGVRRDPALITRARPRMTYWRLPSGANRTSPIVARVGACDRA